MHARIDQVFDHKRHDINLFQFPERFRAATPRTNGARRPLLEAWDGAKTMSDSVYRLPTGVKPRHAAEGPAWTGCARAFARASGMQTRVGAGGSEVGQRWVKTGPADALRGRDTRHLIAIYIELPYAHLRMMKTCSRPPGPSRVARSPLLRRPSTDS